MALNFCPKCGSQLKENSVTCEKCGVDLTSRIEKNKNDAQVEETSDIYADFLERSLAWFIDIMIVLAMVIPLSIYVNFGLFYVFANIYIFIIGFFYFWFFEIFNKGQTFGRWVTKIRAVDEKTLQPAKISTYFTNNVTKGNIFIFFDVFLGIIANINSTGANKKRLRIVQNITEIAIIKVSKTKKE